MHARTNVGALLKRLFAGALLAALAAFHGGAGCTGSQGTEERDDASGGPADATPDRATPIRDGAALDAEEPEPPLPAGLPAGWIRFDGYTKACGLFIPSSRDLLPEPLVYQPCPAGLNPPGLACKYIDPTWVSTSRQQLISTWRQGTRDAAGAVHIQMSKFVGDWIYRLVVGGDGRVEHAILETTPATCTLQGGYLHGGRYAFPIVIGNGGGRYGALAGSWSELRPSVVLKFDAGLAHTPWATPFGVLDGDQTHRLALFSWSTGQKALDVWSPAMDDGLQQVGIAVADTALFWRASSANYSNIRVYTPSAGVAELRSFGADVTQGDFGLGTDGTDLVWQHAFGRTQGTGLYPSFELMTAPFTTSPATLAARRVGKTPNGLAGEPTIVGCGYAAQNNGLVIGITRLADGVSWTLTGTDKSSSIAWGPPIALTCDELFLGGFITGTPKSTIARIRLDSLGPGTPAE